jgi:16S rRNA (guanine527-N7)-methyltransferase
MSNLWQQLLHRDDQIVIAQLSRYIDLLLDANTRMNLTRIANREDAEIKHIADALTLLPFIPAETTSLVDVGSGGGIPGIPLSIVLPNLKVILIESIRKKADFLRQTVQAMNLANVEIVNARVEDVAHSARRESFDVVTARALAPMNVLLEWCLPLVKRSGKLLAMKGEKVVEELAASSHAIKTLCGGTTRVHPVSLPGVDHHVIVEVGKLCKTPVKYPRSPAQVNADPL